jgi:curved DNA-binding protein CbpA
MPQVVRAQLDYYAVLEITPSADTAEVNAAFRRLAWRYHPDRNPAPGATLQFQDINEAHQVLTDPARRTEYDAKWHPRNRDRRQTARIPIQPRYHRHTRRRRHVRAVLLTLFAMLFVSSAWAVIFTAMTAAHSAGPSHIFSGPSRSFAEATPSCSFSMEMFPVTYKDQRGRLTTAWETEVRNCYGGAAHMSSLPDLRQSRAVEFASDPVER